MAEGRYGVTFGKCDSSDWIDWEIELDAEEEDIYYRALKLRIPLNEVPELEAALSRAYEEIEDEEIAMGIDNEDEYVLECTGEGYVDAEEINDLIHSGDTHAIQFFGLEELDDEELEEWDANDLDELPKIIDFVEDFEPSSPYDAGWDLHVEFIDPNEDSVLEEDEARETLTELFNEANGDYSIITDYVKRLNNRWIDFDLKQLAIDIANELNLTDFVI